MSGELALDTIAANQVSKEVAINAIFGEVEAAIAGQRLINMATANIEVTVAQLQRSGSLIVTASVASTPHSILTLDACKRLVSIWNQSANAISIAVGTTTLALAAGASCFVLMDGTANGAEVLGGSDGGGGAAGIPEAPNDGTQYGRQSGAWTAIVAGGGDGSGGGGDGGLVVGHGSGDPHKAWRLNITSTEANDGPASVTRFELYASNNGSGSDLAEVSGTVPFADAAEGAHPASYAFDGNDASFWGGPTTFPAHVGIILPAKVVVLSIRLASSSDGYWVHRCPLNFDLQWSDDTTTGSDGTWTTAFSETQTAAWSGGDNRVFVNGAPTIGTEPAPSAHYYVPVGGTTGQVLEKNSNTDGDTKWATPAAGGGGSGGGSSAPADIRYVMWRDITATDSYANIMEVAFFEGGVGGTQHVPVASYQSNGNSSDGNITHTYDGVDSGNGITANGWAQNLQGGVQVFFLMWDLGAAYPIDTIHYTSRDDYGTQGITSVRQLVSSDGVTFYDVGTYFQNVAYTSSTRTRDIPLGR